MSGRWDEIKQKFDEEEKNFVFFAQAVQSEWPRSREEDLVWRGYEQRQTSLQTIVDEVIAFVPHSGRELEDKLELGRKMFLLSQTFDESWLEGEAEKILPAHHFEVPEDL